MFKAARQAKIKEIMLDQKQVTVHTLSVLLGVSVVTVRSDLEELEQQGILVRTHGGAMLKIAEREVSLKQDEPIQENLHSLRRIADIATKLIRQNEWIFLGPGEICRQIAISLSESDHNSNIITNNLLSVPYLVKNHGNNVIVTGGSVICDGLYMTGEIMRQSLNNFYINKAFFEVAGIDMNGGYTVSSDTEAAVFNMLRPLCREMVFLGDYTVFDNISFMRLGDLSLANIVVSDEKAPASYKDYYFNHNVRFYITYGIDPSTVGANYR